MAPKSISLRVTEELDAALKADAAAVGLPLASFVKMELTRLMVLRGRMERP